MRITARSKKIQEQILKEVRNHPADLARHISELFDISRQAVNRHIQKLIRAEKLSAEGSTRSRRYKIGPIRSTSYTFSLDTSKSSDEHKIYTQQFSWFIDGLKNNIEEIIFYGFTEIVNNAIDHSDGETCLISMSKSHKSLSIAVGDDGEGIFKRIKRLGGLIDERQSIIELSKGKFTTDPSNHSGQGIFFSSRMFDHFIIESKGLKFSHHDGDDFDLFDEVQDDFKALSTFVFMSIDLNTDRTDKEIFDQYSGTEDEDFAFNKTIIPVRLAKIDQEQLVSRSQAKRLLSRIENFKYVSFDFDGVEKVGQAFADEIFRVYSIRHPEVILYFVNACKQVEEMISRAKHS